MATPEAAMAWHRHGGISISIIISELARVCGRCCANISRRHNARTRWRLLYHTAFAAPRAASNMVRRAAYRMLQPFACTHAHARAARLRTARITAHAAYAAVAAARTLPHTHAVGFSPPRLRAVCAHFCAYARLTGRACLRRGCATRHSFTRNYVRCLRLHRTPLTQRRSSARLSRLAVTLLRFAVSVLAGCVLPRMPRVGTPKRAAGTASRVGNTHALNDVAR